MGPEQHDPVVHVFEEFLVVENAGVEQDALPILMRLNQHAAYSVLDEEGFIVGHYNAAYFHLSKPLIVLWLRPLQISSSGLRFDDIPCGHRLYYP